MENPKINIDDYYPPKKKDRYPKQDEAKNNRLNRGKLAFYVSMGAIPVAVVLGGMNSEPVEEPPQPTQEQTTTVDQNQEAPDLADTVEPGSVRSVNFEQQQDGSYTLKDSE